LASRLGIQLSQTFWLPRLPEDSRNGEWFFVVVVVVVIIVVVVVVLK